jgi:Tfp pilus assembly protein PilX
MSSARRLARSLLIRGEDGFTMIIALGVMLVTSLLMIVAFTAANGDITLSARDLTSKQAYFAALAGVQEYEFKLQNNPNYWQSCEQPKSTVPEEANERYEVKLLVANSQKTFSSCSTSSPFTSMIESTGSLANTFRIESIGYSGKDKRRLIATFQVTGFLNYIYFTNFETVDPGLYEAPEGCEGQYYSAWSVNPKKPKCQVIEWLSGDEVSGPMHTNDTAYVTGSVVFGRKGHNPLDPIEMNGGTYGSQSGCKSGATYYSATAAKGECYTTKAEKLEPPESDTSLGVYVQEGGLEFEGATKLELKGTTINASYFNSEGKEVKETGIPWPSNGLIYVQASGTCPQFESENTDTAASEKAARGCGNVYVSGTYSKSLTVAGENDLIINGNLSPTGQTLGNEATGTATLGLIATNYVRVYHPCSGGTNGFGALKNPYIYGAILSTAHSFVADNPECGARLGELHVFGAIAQNYRGVVLRNNGGYFKDYNYDERLATSQPPYFLAPLKAGWKIIRQTAPTAG